MTPPASPLQPAAIADDELPLVTVIVPARNERPYIVECLRSILENGYALDRLQVLVVDAMSTDGTREAVLDLARQHTCVELRDNPNLTTPFALNIGLSAARGAFIFWMSAHNVYEPRYIAESVRWALGTGADNVGGVIIAAPRSTGALATAIVAVLGHPFGVGGSGFRLLPSQPRWVDTVFGGCYRRDVFARVGRFNEALTRGQDMEFNLRLAAAGGRILLVPSIRSTYYARTRFQEFVRHSWVNGVWAILPFGLSSIVPVSGRHLVPLAFVTALIGTLVVALTIPGLRWVPWLVLGLYLALAAAASVQLAVRRRSWRVGILALLVFPTLHLSYGLGSLWGVGRLVAAKLGRPLKPTSAGQNDAS